MDSDGRSGGTERRTRGTERVTSRASRRRGKTRFRPGLLRPAKGPRPARTLRSRVRARRHPSRRSRLQRVLLARDRVASNGSLRWTLSVQRVRPLSGWYSFKRRPACGVTLPVLVRRVFSKQAAARRKSRALNWSGRRPEPRAKRAEPRKSQRAPLRGFRCSANLNRGRFQDLPGKPARCACGRVPSGASLCRRAGAAVEVRARLTSRAPRQLRRRGWSRACAADARSRASGARDS